jgi:hypothetical protein
MRVALVRSKMCAEEAGIQANHRRPIGDEARILPGGEALLLAAAPAKEEASRLRLCQRR